LRGHAFLLLVSVSWLGPAQAGIAVGISRAPDCAVAVRCVRLSDNLPAPPRTDLPAAPQFVPGETVTPPHSIVPPTAKDIADFVRRVSNGWCAVSVNGNAIADAFEPDLSGLADLNALADLGGFDHFNIEQDITDISHNDNPGLLPRWTGVDPAVGGNAYDQFDDAYPWYYNEVFKVGEWMPMYDNPDIYVTNPSAQYVGLNWQDAPNMGPRNAGTVLTFVDYLVGVYPDHTGVRISQAFANAQGTNFEWTFRQGRWGAKSRDRFRSPGEPEPGSHGSIKFLGYFDADSSQLSPAAANACAAASEPGHLLPTKPSIREPR